MKTYLIFVSLLVFISCSSQKQEGHPHNEKRSEIRKTILDCISTSNDISDALKNHIANLKKTDEQVLFNFNRVNLEEKDHETIRECRKKVFHERRQKKDIINKQKSK